MHMYHQPSPSKYSGKNEEEEGLFKRRHLNFITLKMIFNFLAVFNILCIFSVLSLILKLSVYGVSEVVEREILIRND